MKSKGHIYMANLIMQELKEKSTVTIVGVKEFSVPEEVRSAILGAPKAFRAGAVGPDFYPDMIDGQMNIHPSNSGRWLEIMEEELSKTSRSSSEWKEAYAFYLGYMMHYANDMWTHDYVNSLSGGSFPGLEDIKKNPLSANIAIRHILIESYIDNKISSAQSMEIEAPIPFVQRCFTSPKARKLYGDMSVIGYLLNFRDEVNQHSQDSTTNMLDIFNYYSSWKSQIDRAILEWFKLWNTIANDFLRDDGGFTQAKEHFSYWLKKYALEATSLPKWFIDLGRAIGVIADSIDIILEPIKLLFKSILSSMLKAATGYSIEDIEKIMELFKKVMKQPELYLNGGILFDEKNMTDKLDKDMGNFGKGGSSYNNQQLLCFDRALNMGRLAVMGVDNLNEIMGRYQNYVRFSKVGMKTSVNKLTITIKTANKLYAGTDDNVYFGLVLNTGNVMEVLLDKRGYNDFERGDKDTYTFTLPRTVMYSEISHIQLRKDYINIDDDWTIASMLVKDTADGFVLLNTTKQLTLQKRRKYTFPVSKKNSTQQLQVDCKVLNHIYSLDVATPPNQPNYKSWENCYLKANDRIWNEFTVPVFKLGSGSKAVSRPVDSGTTRPSRPKRPTGTTRPSSVRR